MATPGIAEPNSRAPTTAVRHCLLLFLVVVVTGTGIAAVGVWLVLISLCVLAIIVGGLRRLRRSR